MSVMDPRQYVPTRPRTDQTIQRYSIMGVVLLITLISGLLGDSLVGVYQIDVGEPLPRGWQWLLGASEQSFNTQTTALLVGVVLLGFAIGGSWFLIHVSIRWLRSQIGR
jgi:hypothetical protein